MLYIEKSKSGILKYFEAFRRLPYDFRCCEIDIPIKECDVDSIPESFIFGTDRKDILMKIYSYLGDYKKSRHCSICLIAPEISNPNILRIKLGFNSDRFIDKNNSNSDNTEATDINRAKASDIDINSLNIKVNNNFRYVNSELHDIVNRISDMEVKLEATQDSFVKHNKESIEYSREVNFRFKDIEKRLNFYFGKYDPLRKRPEPVIQGENPLPQNMESPSPQTSYTKEIDKVQLDSMVIWSEEADKRLYRLEQSVTDIQDGSDPKINGLSGRVDKLDRHIFTPEGDVSKALSDIRKELRKIWSFLQTTDIKLDKLERHRIKVTETLADSKNTGNSEKYKPQPIYLKSKNGMDLVPGTPVLILDYAEMYFVAGVCDDRGFIPMKRVIRRDFNDGYETIQVTTITVMLKPEDIEVIEI